MQSVIHKLYESFKVKKLPDFVEGSLLSLLCSSKRHVYVEAQCGLHTVFGTEIGFPITMLYREAPSSTYRNLQIASIQLQTYFD